MSSYRERSGLSRVLSWVLVAIVAIAVLKLAFWVVGVAFGLGGFLLFTVGPLVLIGWVVVKVVRALSRPPRY